MTGDHTGKRELASRLHPEFFPLLAALFTYGIYLRTTAPTISAADSGELITAAWFMGVPHQPGYPLFCLLSKAAALAIPLGGVAFRTNILSAILGAGTCFIVSIILARRVSLPGDIAALLALILATSRSFWGVSIITEVYALNTFILVLLLRALLDDEFSPTRKIMVSIFLWGLAMATHPTSILLLPALVLAAVLYYPRPGYKAVFCTVLVLLVALSVYVYLPLRAASSPPVNWGLSYNISNFLIHTCKKFSVNVFQKTPWKIPKSPSMIFILFKNALWALVLASPFPLLVLAGVSLYRHGRFIGNRAAPWFASIVFFFAAVAFSFDFYELDVMVDYGTKFFIPVFLVCLLLGARLLSGRLQRGRAPRRNHTLLRWALVLILAVSVIQNAPVNNLRTFTVYYDYGMNLLKSVPPNATVFADGDTQIFPVAFLKTVLNRRPDVTFIDQKGNMFVYFYGPVKLTLKSRNAVETAFIEKSAAPVCYTERLIPFYVPGYRLKQDGIIFRALRRGSVSEKYTAAPWRRYRVRHPEDKSSIWGKSNIKGKSNIDCVTRIVLARYWTFLGNFLMSNGFFSEAQRCHRNCLELDYRTSVALTNLGMMYSKQGEKTRALQEFQRAIDNRDPDIEDPYVNLVQILQEMGRNLEAREILDRGLAVFPSSPSLHLRAGILHAYTLGNPADAVHHWRRYLELEPQPDGQPGAERTTVEAEIKRLELMIK